MAYEDGAGGGLDYFPYRFGRSRLLFRGPRPKIDGGYVAVLGGTETYGKYVAAPFPAVLGERIGLPVVNFGCMHAGVNVFVDDDSVLAACGEADLTVIQVMGAANMSNRLYSVHPRRNDRFLKASPALRALYPSLDFTEFNFTRHLLTALEGHAPEAFATVRQELRDAWLGRMRMLLRKIGGRVVLLWMSNRAPGHGADRATGADPLFVDRTLIEALRPDVTDIVEVVASDAARTDGLDGKIFAPMEAPAAMEVPGPLFHHEVADALAACLAVHLKRERPGDRVAGPRESLAEGLRAFR
jgi:hypothetical protein